MKNNMMKAGGKTAAEEHCSKSAAKMFMCPVCNAILMSSRLGELVVSGKDKEDTPVWTLCALSY